MSQIKLFILVFKRIQILILQRVRVAVDLFETREMYQNIIWLYISVHNMLFMDISQPQERLDQSPPNNFLIKIVGYRIVRLLQELPLVLFMFKLYKHLHAQIVSQIRDQAQLFLLLVQKNFLILDYIGVPQAVKEAHFSQSHLHQLVCF